MLGASSVSLGKRAPVRAAAAKKLDHDPEPNAAEALVKAAGDKDLHVRAAALEAITLREAPSLIPRINAALDDGKDVVRFTAAACVAHLSGLPEKTHVPSTASHNRPFGESSVARGRSRRKNGNFDARRKPFRTVDALRGLLVVGFLRLKNVGNEFLRVAVDNGKPGALHLHHDAMAFLEHMVCRV